MVQLNYSSKFKIILILFIFSMLHSGVANGQGLNKTDAQGKKQGGWKHYQGAVLKFTGNYKDNLPEGEFIYYNDDGTIKAKSIFSAQAQRVVVTNFHLSGEKKSEGGFLNKKKEGEWRYYSEDKILVAVENYKSGLKEGLSYNYYRNGKIYLEANYVNNLKSGKWNSYFPDGQLKLVINYSNDKLSGAAVFNYSGGKLMIQGEYLNNEKSGIWNYLDLSGKIVRKEIYKSGDLISSEGVVFSVDDSIKLPEPEKY